jgi:phosphate uptake regulator
MMKSAVDKLYENVITSFESKSLALKEEVDGYEDLVDTYNDNLAKNHIARLHNSECSSESGGIFLSIVSNMERIADHFRNVFKSMDTYVSPVKIKANVKDNSNNGSQPTADVVENTAQDSDQNDNAISKVSQNK